MQTNLAVFNPEGKDPEDLHTDSGDLWRNSLFQKRVAAAIESGDLDPESIPPSVRFGPGEEATVEDLNEILEFRRKFDGIVNMPREQKKPIFRQERALDD